MKRELKKVFSFILVLALVISCIPAPISLAAVPADLGIEYSEADAPTTAPSSLENGQIWTDKSVESNGDGSFDITLKAIGQNYALPPEENPNPLDVVFVLDCSYSMSVDTGTNQPNQRLPQMKAAAKEAVDILLGVQGNKIALVRFNNTASQVGSGFSTNSSTLKTNIDGLSTNLNTPYTNIQDGFRMAKSILNARSAADKATRKPVIILMSDGAPTRYTTSLTGTDWDTDQNTPNDAIWWAIQQGWDTKINSTTNTTTDDIDIYTIGFMVGSNNKAIATLMPTDTNTYNYRPDAYTYSGDIRTGQRIVTVVYENLSNDYGNTWTGWQATSSSSNGSTNNSSWTPFSGYPSQPSNTGWSALVPLDGPLNTNITDNSGQTRRQTANFRFTQTRTEYRNIDEVASGKVPFNHTYWSVGSSTDSANADDIFNAFVELATQLTNFKPMSYSGTGDSKDYSDVTITDVLGSEFELVNGTLTAEEGNINYDPLTHKVTWTIDGNDLTTLAAGEDDPLNATDIPEATFRVVIKDSAVAGVEYETNETANASFTVLDANPYYAQVGTVTQSLTNNGRLKLSAMDVETSIQITKKVVGPASNDPRTFSFNVYYNLEDGEPGLDNPPINMEPISITVTGEDSESINVPLTIPASAFDGDGHLILYVKEMSSTTEQYWEYDTWDTITIDRNAETPPNVTFTNTYDPKGTLTVTKTWSGVTGGAVEFKLLKEITSGDGLAWVPADEGTRVLTDSTDPNVPAWTVSIGNLDLGTKYRVEEINEGLYDYTIGYNPLTVEFTPESLNQTIEITNTYVPPEGKITIVKEWVDNGNEAGDRPEEITFSYTGPGDTEGTITLEAPEEASNEWTYTLSTSVFGEFTFTENFIQDYQATETTQSVTIVKDVVASRSAVVTYENTYVEPKGELTVTKEWTDENDGDTSYRPENGITIRLLKWLGVNPDAPDADPWTEVDVETLTSGVQPNLWIHTFDNLTMGTYRVTEDEVADYTTTISEDVTLTKKTTSGSISSRNGEISVTNSFDHPKGSITVNKVWTDDEITSEVRPDEITVVLLKDGVEIGTEDLSGGAYPETTWTSTFEDLDLDGSTYTVEELTIDYYDTSVTYAGIGASNGGIVLDKDHRSGTATVNNTYALGTITVSKVWDHTGNNDLRPNSVEVTLMKTGPEIIETSTVVETEVDGEIVTEAAITTEEAMTTKEVGTKPVTSSNAAVFFNLEMGDDIQYFVVEKDIPSFYTASYSNGDDPLYLTEASPNGQITVTNTYEEPTGELTVIKDWNHGNNPNRPNSVKVNLFANNNQTPVDSVTLNEENDWTHTFTELILGYTYTVDEESVAKYNTAYYTDSSEEEIFESYTPLKSNLEEEVVVSNTYNTERGDLQVTKTWVGTTGDAIRVYLTCYDGENQIEFSRSATLSAINSWTYTFEELELYGETGLYQYHIAESGAGVLYSQSSYDNIVSVNTETTTAVVIENTYTPNKGELTITKEWRGTDGELMTAPDVTIEAILVEVGDDNWEDAPSYLLNDANNWTVTVGGLNVDKTYRVIELNGQEEYLVDYSTEAISFSAADLDQTVTITNTRTSDEPEIGIEKEVFNSGTILDDGSATLHYALHIYNHGNRTLTDIFILDEMVPSGSAVGAEVSYSTGEAIGNEIKINIPGGLEPEASTVVYYSVTVDKAGVYDNEATVYGYYGETEVFATGDAEGLVKPPGLHIEKEVIGAASKAGSGGTFTYQLTISYDGEIPLYNVTVQDVMESTNPDATMTYNYGGSDFDPVTKTFTIGNLYGSIEGGEGDEIVINYTVTVTGRGTYDNTATVVGEYSTIEVINGEQTQISGDLTDSDDATVRVTRPSNPPDDPDDPDDPQDPPVIIPDDETPAGPVILEDEAVPAGPLPKTGGIPAMLLFGAGALLAGGGLILRRKETKNK